ncbi:XRE family transcriptional regulator [Streptomyces sp. NPDC051109]|uniref:XRE family transcriptional regulator n=1 Tax=Streptomyces sp. NPDC051109 TaxID=3365642 RepID=UPI00379AE50D
MAELSHVHEGALRRRHLRVQALADRTGIGPPGIRVFVRHGTTGPMHPMEQDLGGLAHAFDLPPPEVLTGAALPGVAGA